MNRENYISYSEGKINLLLTAPHGGSLKPKDIVSRTTGTRTKDTYTKILILEIASLYENHPFLAISEIHRSKVDLNRKLDLATDGDPLAKNIWYSWNNIIDKLKTNMSNSFPKSLHVDIHSHNNDDQIQLGYDINSRDYLKFMKDKIPPRKSTLDTLEQDLYEMLFGEYSLKRQLEIIDHKVFMPCGTEQYFNGGYNVEHFSGNGLGSIQIEFPVSVLKNNVKKIAKDFFLCLEIFRGKFV